MLLSFLKGRRGILLPFSVSFALVIFLSLIGADWGIALSIASFIGSLTVAEGVARALWEDDAVYRLAMLYGNTGVLFIMAGAVMTVSLILNVLVAFVVWVVASAPVLPYAPGIAVWVLSSALLCTLTSAMGEVAGVSMGFIAAVLQVPLLVGFYGYLSGGDPIANLGLVVVMGIFYASFIGVFADTLMEA